MYAGLVWTSLILTSATHTSQLQLNPITLSAGIRRCYQTKSLINWWQHVVNQCLMQYARTTSHSSLRTIPRTCLNFYSNISQTTKKLRLWPKSLTWQNNCWWTLLTCSHVPEFSRVSRPTNRRIIIHFPSSKPLISTAYISSHMTNLSASVLTQSNASNNANTAIFNMSMQQMSANKAQRSNDQTRMLQQFAMMTNNQPGSQRFSGQNRLWITAGGGALMLPVLTPTQHWTPAQQWAPPGGEGCGGNRSRLGSGRRNQHRTILPHQYWFSRICHALWRRQQCYHYHLE